MNPVRTITRKRDGGEISAHEIGAFIGGYVSGEIPDYQMSALAMAIYLRGMSADETAALTDHMLASGATFDWTAGDLPKVDKHSTGGIGDKVSLPLAAMLACCDVQVPMISGRGLGSTGGTLDKLDSIPGFRTDLGMDEMREVIHRVGCVISGATPDLVPADRKLYALRDVTATVPSIPLITASIMSKKLAEGLDALVLDVKFGSGAFMKSVDAARMLAKSLVDTGQRMGVATTALLTDMNQPLGRMVGNAVEVNEAIAVLEGRGPDDLMEVTLALGVELLVSVEDDFSPTPARGEGQAAPLQGPARGEASSAIDSARQQLQKTISSGAARERFSQMVSAQGGDLDARRIVAPASEVISIRAGHVAEIDAERLGEAVIAMRGGRRQLGDPLDYSTGFEMLVRLGDQVDMGQPLARVFAPDDVAYAGREKLQASICLSDEPPQLGPLLLDRIY
ncbi:MAG: thymidine phosphorylase [Pirellulales bacterium]|nr:thymidine phosphorylase [Pirellulales bacterium]